MVACSGEATLSGARRRSVGLALLVTACGGLLACRAGPEPRGRVLLVGLDGATLRVARPLMKAGRLPNLARLAAEGVAGPLRSIQPLESPRIWNSIATGKTPEKHGILGFTRRDAQGVEHLYRSSDRKVHALWNIASEAERSVAVVNWWNTHPVERVRGVMVSDHLFVSEVEARRELTGAVAAPDGALVFPADWHPRLSALASEPAAHEAVDPLREPEQIPAWIRNHSFSHWLWRDAVLARFALEIEAETQPDLLMLLLTGIDRASHVLWIGVESNEPYPEALHLSDPERRAVREALEACYELTDGLVGRLLERYRPEDLVLVVSDHGFEAGVDLASLTGVHHGDAAAHGLIFARGPGILPRSEVGLVSVLDVTPTILTWLGLPIAADMDGGVARFLRDVRVATIPTWDGQPVERLPGEASGAEQELVRQLRELGYVE